jgi:ribonuclease P protein component
MLPRINRIKKKNDFEKIFKKGASFRDNFLILKILSNNLKVNRFASVISQKVSKKAVVRNKIRRRITAVIKTKITILKNGLDFVFIILPGFEKKDFLEIKKTIESVFEKAKITKNV